MSKALEQDSSRQLMFHMQGVMLVLDNYQTLKYKNSAYKNTGMLRP